VNKSPPSLKLWRASFAVFVWDGHILLGEVWPAIRSLPRSGKRKRPPAPRLRRADFAS
jgi:hypothetical protein